MGQWSQLYNLLKPVLNDGTVFLQSLAVFGAGLMAIYYKLREIFADVQQDQMYAQKTVKVITALGLIFIVPTLIKIVQNYLG